MKRITIAIATAYYTIQAKEVKAVVVGDWAVHHYAGNWIVTHIPTGRGVLVVDSETHGIRVAKRLRREVDMRSFPDCFLPANVHPLIEHDALETIDRIVREEKARRHDEVA
ncbi:MAG TPA: hypothetical protein VLN57_20920 [Xanthobacteraceae bacterium]|nr:hypothetical protein [Xanthobacteraceae bacterium]